MSDQTIHPSTTQSIEEGVNVLFRNAREGIQQRRLECETQIQKSPKKAMLGAFAAGYFMHHMPVRTILITQVRVLGALTPPALLLFGAAKLCDLLKKQH